MLGSGKYSGSSSVEDAFSRAFLAGLGIGGCSGSASTRRRSNSLRSRPSGWAPLSRGQSSLSPGRPGSIRGRTRNANVCAVTSSLHRVERCLCFPPMSKVDSPSPPEYLPSRPGPANDRVCGYAGTSVPNGPLKADPRFGRWLGLAVNLHSFLIHAQTAPAWSPGLGLRFALHVSCFEQAIALARPLLRTHGKEGRLPRWGRPARLITSRLVLLAAQPPMPTAPMLGYLLFELFGNLHPLIPRKRLPCTEAKIGQPLRSELWRTGARDPR